MTEHQRTPTRRENFTRKLIESLDSPESGRVTVYDSNTAHLGLRIEANGNKSFFWFRKVRGVPTFRAIGAWPGEVTIDKARETADEWNGDLAEYRRHNYEGQNPFEKPSEELTLGELVDAYCERHVRPHGKRPERDEKRVRAQVEFHLKHWKQRKLSTITRKEVVNLHAEIGKDHKFVANRVFQLLRLLYNFALSAELWSGENPAARIKRFAEPPRKRFLDHQEIARLFTALKSEPSQDLKDFVVLSLFSGCRKADVFSARWDNISFEDRRWSIPDPKREPYAVPITVEAEKVLRDRLKRRRENNPWVFPSHSTSGHVEDLKDRWKLLLQRARIKNLRIHDLRRTQGSWSAAQGNSLLLVGKSLGHASPQSTKVYAQLDIDPVRAAMAATNAALAAASRRKPRLLTAGVGHGQA